MSPAFFNVAVRETDSRRHMRLGDGFRATKRVHAIGFDCEAAAWLSENNPGAIDSTQVIDAETGRVVRQVRASAGDRWSCRWLADLPRPAHADLLRPALPGA